MISQFIDFWFTDSSASILSFFLIWNLHLKITLLTIKRQLLLEVGNEGISKRRNQLVLMVDSYLTWSRLPSACNMQSLNGLLWIGDFICYLKQRFFLTFMELLFAH